MPDKLIAGTLSFTSKLLIFQNEDAKAGEPQWTVFLAEREAKPQGQGDGASDPGWPAKGRPA